MESEQRSLSHTLSRLSQAVLNRQESYAFAAQHTRNRGLKLVLKSYAQERAQFQGQLRSFAGQPPAVAAQAAGSALGRGWASMRAWFTIRRQSRQRLLMQNVFVILHGVDEVIDFGGSHGGSGHWNRPVRNQHGFEGLAGRCELLLDGGVEHAGVVLRHVEGSVAEKLAHGVDGETVVDELGGEGVAQLVRRDLDATEPPPACQLIAHGFIGEQATIVAPEMVVGAGRPLHNIEVKAVRQGGSHEDDAIVATLGIADEDAAVGEIDVAKTQVKELVEPHAGVGQRQEPGAAGTGGERWLLGLSQHSLDQAFVVRSTQVLGQWVGEVWRRDAEDVGIQRLTTIADQLQKCAQVAEFGVA